MLCGSLDGRGVWGRMDTCVCMAGSLPCSPGTITTLFVSWLYLGLPHCRRILYQLSHQGSPGLLEWVAYPFSRGSSQPQESNLGLLHCRRILYWLSYQGSPQYKIKSKKKKKEIHVREGLYIVTTLSNDDPRFLETCLSFEYFVIKEIMGPYFDIMI